MTNNTDKKPRETAPKVVALVLSKASTVEPPEDWEPNCRYGLQRRDASPGGRLVRLEDVARWLAQTYPREEVLHRLAVELIGGDGAATSCLYLLNTQTYAIPLIVNGHPNPLAGSFWQFLPWVEANTIAEYVGRDLYEAFARVWPGLADPSTDHDWMVKRAIEKNREASARAQAERDGLDDPIEYWPDDGYLLEMLRILALPIAKAHEFWGYGRAFSEVPSEATQETAQVGQLAPPANHRKVLKKDLYPEWTGQRLQSRLLELKHKGCRAPVAELEKESGLSAREIHRRRVEFLGAKGSPMSQISSVLGSAGSKSKKTSSKA